MAHSNRKTIADLVRENEQIAAPASATFKWDKTGKPRFGDAIIQGEHNLHESGQFNDEKLAELLDAYPRDKLGIYKFPDHSDGVVKADHGRAPKLTGAELVQAVKSGKIWLNLRAVNRHLDQYAKISETLFSQLEQSFDVKTLKQDVGVLISSPNIHVHYHLDIPLVTLVQLRGEKTLYLYPAKAPFRTAEAVEKIARRTQDEELHFDHSFEENVKAVKLSPGMAITWPQTAPHRVQNSDCLNVSLSCEFMTLPAIMRANAVYANGLLRDRVGADMGYPDKAGPATLVKAGVARVAKKLTPVAEKGPTPITFELLPSGEVSYFPRRRVTDFPAVKAPKGEASAQTPHCEIKQATELTGENIRDWSELQEQCWNFSTPLLSPEFAQLIAKCRADVRCVLIYQGDVLQAVLAGHMTGKGQMTPLGAPFCDYAGPMIRPGSDLSASQIVELAGLTRYRAMTSIMSQSGRRATDVALQDHGHVISLDGHSAKEYLEARRVIHAKRFKNMRRLLNKLERDHGSIELCFGMPSKADYDTLLNWKSRQFESEGMLDLTKAKYTQDVMRTAFSEVRKTDSDIGGFYTALKVDGKIVTGHFGVRQGEKFHPWISAYDPAYEEYSPGVLLLYRCVEMMDAMGLQVYDLAEGHDGYKKYFAKPMRAVAELSFTSKTGFGTVYALGDKVWKTMSAENTQGAAARLRRRLMLSAYCEPSQVKRLGDVVTALRKRGIKR